MVSLHTYGPLGSARYALVKQSSTEIFLLHVSLKTNELFIFLATCFKVPIQLIPTGIIIFLTPRNNCFYFLNNSGRPQRPIVCNMFHSKLFLFSHRLHRLHLNCSCSHTNIICSALNISCSPIVTIVSIDDGDDGDIYMRTRTIKMGTMGTIDIYMRTRTI